MEESVSMIIDGIWIGGEAASASKQFFEKEEITAVVNATPNLQHNFVKMGVEYLRIPAGDSRDEEDIKMIKDAMPIVVQWMYYHHKILSKNILVHCHHGINRSATFVCAYLMKYYGLSLKDAIEFLTIRRQAVFYHGDRPTFKMILELWEEECKGSNKK